MSIHQWKSSYKSSRLVSSISIKPTQALSPTRQKSNHHYGATTGPSPLSLGHLSAVKASHFFVEPLNRQCQQSWRRELLSRQWISA